MNYFLADQMGVWGWVGLAYVLGLLTPYLPAIVGTIRTTVQKAKGK